eukprot:10800940-Alexandrium_andersonii.AAC.1
MGVDVYDHTVILPHDIFAAAASRNPEALLGAPDAERLLQFWGAARDQEWFQEHPLKDVALADPARTIPVRVHGDGCKGFVVYSWTSAVSR